MKTKGMILLLAALFFCSFLILQYGCKKDEDEPNDPTSPTATFTDPRDGQVYNIVTIGSKTWFAENLNYQTTNSLWYNNSLVNGDIYGRLYT